MLHLLDPEQTPVPEPQLTKALDVIESWMVRRMLVRATTKAHTKVLSELISRLRAGDRTQAGDITEAFLASQTGDSQYWPDDEELSGALRELAVYQRLSRGRLRMVLEAVEDHRRGWKNGKAGLGGERVARGKYAIEHIMPRHWAAHWPPPDGPHGELKRERLMHTLGNLTLLTGPLNSKVSNGPWAGSGGKWEALEAHDVLLLNNDLRKQAPDVWTHERIRARAEVTIRAILEIWPVPPGHRSRAEHKKASHHRKPEIADLINAGLLTAGMTLYPGRKKFEGRLATLLGDGQIEYNGTVYPRPQPAATAVAGQLVLGWWFFRIDKTGGRSLRDVLRDYVATLDGDIESQGDEEDEDDE